MAPLKLALFCRHINDRFFLKNLGKSTENLAKTNVAIANLAEVNPGRGRGMFCLGRGEIVLPFY